MPTFDSMRLALQAHQIQRLRETYDDLIHDATYSTLAEFFFTHIYHTGERDARNESFLRLYKHMRAVIGPFIIQGLADLVELHILTEKLDAQVTASLLKMQASEGFSRTEYERAYRYADNYDHRVVQLDRLEGSNVFVHKVSQQRFVGALLTTFKKAARLIGASPMIDFLDLGFRAYHKVPDIRPFLQIMRTREQSRLDRIWKEIPHDTRFAPD